MTPEDEYLMSMMFQLGGPQPLTQIEVVFNWFDELKRYSNQLVTSVTTVQLPG